MIRRWSSAVLLAGCLTLFLAVALHQLDLPGLYYDEALDLAPMLEVMRGQPTPLLRGIGLSAGGYAYPVMLMDYMGSLNGYLSAPFLAALGPGVAAARLQPILFSAVTILLAYALARSWFGRGAGLLTALLLAVQPSFIWFSRQGISVTSVMTVFSLSSLLLLDRWRRHGRANPQSPISNLLLLSAGLLLGLGVWAKLVFLWWLIVVGVMALAWILGGAPASAAPRAESRAERLKLALRALPWVLAGFLIGAAPLIYYNLHDLVVRPFDLRNAHTAHLLLRSLFEPTAYGVNNLDVWTNLGKAVVDFQVFLDGSYFWYNGVPFSNVYAMPAFLIAAVAGSLLSIRRARSERLKWWAALASIAATVAASSFTVSGLWATHLFIIVPLPQMTVATGAVWLAEGVTRRLGGKAARGCAPIRHPVTLSPCHPVTSSPLHLFTLSSTLLATLLLALPVSRDLWVSQQHHATLAQTGGSGRFSDAVYKLAAHLDAQGAAEPVALDWGIERNVRLLTGDRVRPVEVFGFTPEPDAGFEERVRDLLADESRQYIVLWDRFAVYNRRSAFTRIARQMGRQVVETFIAHERSGLPVYVVLQAEKPK